VVQSGNATEPYGYLRALGGIHAREERDAGQEPLVLPALLLDRLDDLPPARWISLTGSRAARCVQDVQQQEVCKTCARRAAARRAAARRSKACARCAADAAQKSARDARRGGRPDLVAVGQAVHQEHLAVRGRGDRRRPRLWALPQHPLSSISVAAVHSCGGRWVACVLATLRSVT
jgi:hypothetical protein